MRFQKKRGPIIEGLKARGILLGSLSETPETVIWLHVLRRSNCKVYVSNDSIGHVTAILQPDDLPSEPTGFGLDADILWELLNKVTGWQCVLVNTACAFTLGAIIKEQLQTPIRYLNDIYHVLDKPVLSCSNEAVRRLTMDDIGLVESVDPELRPTGFWGHIEISLTEGIVAGAIVDGRLVASAFVSSLGEHYADIGAYTHENFRGRGFATAAASIVARCVQDRRRIPVWGCGEHNIPSLKVAARLGFTKVSRRTYIILEKFLPEVSRRTYSLP
jgi:GNAT superfamily N-acetyltransferase